jgi:hypothetical protein
MAVNDVYRAEIYQNVGSELTMNVLHVRETVSETINPVTAAVIVEMVVALYDKIAENLSEDWRVIQISVRRVTGGIPATLVLGGAEAIVGAITGEIVPSQAAVLVSLYSTNPDRTGRGRQYLPGLSEADQNEGQLTEARYSAMVTDLDAAYIGEKGPFLAGDGKFRFTIWAPNSVAAAAAQDVQSIIVRPNMATQRSRRAHPGFAT